MGIRRFLRRVKDEELNRVYLDGDYLGVRVENQYRQNGAVDGDLAVELSEARIGQTVAKAVAREKLLDGAPGSHKMLLEAMQPGPKKRERWFGEGLRRKRGIER